MNKTHIHHSCPFIDNIIQYTEWLADAAGEGLTANAYDFAMQIEENAEAVREINKELREMAESASEQVVDLSSSLEHYERLIKNLQDEIEELRERNSSLEEAYELR